MPGSIGFIIIVADCSKMFTKVEVDCEMKEHSNNKNYIYLETHMCKRSNKSKDRIKYADIINSVDILHGVYFI